MFCRYCGQQIADNCRFCPKCGANLQRTTQTNSYANTGAARQPVNKESLQHTVNGISATINEMAGESGPVKIELKDLWSEAFKSHDRREQ